MSSIMIFQKPNSELYFFTKVIKLFIEISPFRCVTKGFVDDKPALIYGMDSYQLGKKLLPESMMTRYYETIWHIQVKVK